MENDKNISSRDSNIDIEADGKEVTQIVDDILERKIKMVIFTKPVPKTPVKLTKKNLKSI